VSVFFPPSAADLFDVLSVCLVIADNHFDEISILIVDHTRKLKFYIELDNIPDFAILTKQKPRKIHTFLKVISKKLAD